MLLPIILVTLTTQHHVPLLQHTIFYDFIIGIQDDLNHRFNRTVTIIKYKYAHTIQHYMEGLR